MHPYPSVSVIIPIRTGSQRVPQKNTRSFAGIRGGLTALKLRQLATTSGLAEIVVDTDEPSIHDIVDSLELNAAQRSLIKITERDPWYARNETSTDDLIGYLAGKVTGDILLWTHVTSPLVDGPIYQTAIARYRAALAEGYDSLMTVTRLQEFIWDSGKAVNYDYERVKWPRTQDIVPWFFINSAIFIYDAKLAVARKNRIGDRPFMMELNKTEGWDVDWPEDFQVAELLYLGRK